jgi:hypothetical protein
MKGYSRDDILDKEELDRLFSDDAPETVHVKEETYLVYPEGMMTIEEMTINPDGTHPEKQEVKRETKKQAAPKKTKVVKEPAEKQEKKPDFISELGLDFLKSQPLQPNKKVILEVTKPIKFKTSFFCHSIVENSVFVICILDTRAKEELIEMNFEETDLSFLLEIEGKRIEITPTPELLQFTLGKLRFFLFLKKDNYPPDN